MTRLWIYLLLVIVFVGASPDAPYDFAPLYNGAAAVLRGDDPYAESVTERNQVVAYGRFAKVGEDEMRIAHPLTTLFLFMPFTVFPIETAALLYRVLAAMLFIIALVRLGAHPIWAFCIVVLMREPVVGFMLGQTALWTAAMCTFALDAITRKQEEKAALFFVLAAIQPIVSVPLALFMLYRRGLNLYITLMTIWIVISVNVGGLWMIEWLGVIQKYPDYVSYMVWIPKLIPAVIPAALFILVMGMREKDDILRYGLVTSGVLLLAPLTGLYHLAMLTPAFLRLRKWMVVAYGMSAWALSVAPFEIRQFFPLTLLLLIAMRGQMTLSAEEEHRMSSAPIVPYPDQRRFHEFT